MYFCTCFRSNDNNFKCLNEEKFNRDISHRAQPQIRRQDSTGHLNKNRMGPFHLKGVGKTFHLFPMN